MPKTTYRLYSNGKSVYPDVRHQELKARARAFNGKPGEKPDPSRTEDNLPYLANTYELHGGVLRVSQQMPAEVPALEFDLSRCAAVYVENTKVFDLRTHGTNGSHVMVMNAVRQAYPEQNNPVVLLAHHGLLTQTVFMFAPIQNIRDDFRLNHHEIDFQINEVYFLKGENGSMLMKINFVAQTVKFVPQTVEDIQNAGDAGFQKVLDSTKAQGVPFLCEVNCTFKLQTVNSHLQDDSQVPYYGIHHDLAAKNIRVDIHELDVTICDLPGQDMSQLYRLSPNTLGAYRNAAFPPTDCLSRFCGCLFGQPRPIPGLVVQCERGDAVAVQPGMMTTGFNIQ